MSVRPGIGLATPPPPQKARYNHSNHCATNAVLSIVNTSYLEKMVSFEFWVVVFVAFVSHTQNVCVANVIIVITSYSYIACRIDTIRTHQ